MDPLIPNCLKSDDGKIFRQPSPDPGLRRWLYIQEMQANGANVGVAVRTKAQGFTAIGIFLFFGALMASLAAVTLLWRGTVLDVSGR
jgi:hypothetical protein